MRYTSRQQLSSQLSEWESHNAGLRTLLLGLPFRGNFIQLFMEEVRADYRKLDASEVYPDKT